MNILNKLDRIPPPYSTIFALVMVSLLGLFLILWQDQAHLLGLGIVAGGFLSVIFKTIAESPGAELWQQIRTFLSGQGHETEADTPSPSVHLTVPTPADRPIPGRPASSARITLRSGGSV